MKKKILFVFAAFCSLFAALHFAGAINVNMKDAYAIKETIVSEIQGNILEPLSADNLQLKRANVDVPMEYGLKRLGGKYYFWAIAPNSAGNYSLIIKDIVTITGGETKKIDFSQSFLVSENLTDYNVKPGFVLSDRDFELKVLLNEDFEKKIISEFPDKREIILQPGENKISFHINDFTNSSITHIFIGRYRIPIYLIGKNDQNAVYASNLQELKFQPEMVDGEFMLGDNTKYLIGLKNLGNDRVENISFYYDKSKFSPSVEDNISLNQNEIIYFNLTIKNLSIGAFNENIYAKSANSSARLAFRLNVLENDALTEENKSENEDRYRCAEISGGRICAEEQVCSGEVKDSLSGPCCVGICTAKPSPSKAWVGFLLAGVVILIGVIVYVKYKKVKADKNPLQKKIAENEKKIL
jgi:hypothetical protein